MLSIEKVLAKAAFIGKVSGVSFYEHPVHGDEAGMIAIWRDKIVSTDFYDLPEEDDIGEPADFMRLYAVPTNGVLTRVDEA